MTDEEVICAWMEPNPTKHWLGVVAEQGRMPEWWAMQDGLVCTWRPRTLDLVALWEVEERLKQERDRAAALPFDSMPAEALACVRRWTEYRSKLWALTDANDAFNHADAFHATPEQRIKALSAVLRSLVEPR